MFTYSGYKYIISLGSRKPPSPTYCPYAGKIERRKTYNTISYKEHTKRMKPTVAY
jgi:hypothetical protein